MTFVPGYEQDIFVSYAGVDDQPLSGTKEGWVTMLAKNLKIKLAQRLGRPDAYTLWMDPQLAGNVPITPEILNTLRSTATFVMVLSPGYLASYWCQKEQQEFVRLIQERVRGGSRVFLVEIDRVEREKRPSELQDLLGYQFWAADREGKAPRLLQPQPLGHPAYDQRYYDVIDDLSQDLATELQKIKSSVKSTAEEDLPESNVLATIFLAEVTGDLYFLREEVKRYLIQAHLKVLPEINYPSEAHAFQQAVSKDLARSDLFVQLLSATPDRKPSDLPQGYLRCQYELAQSLQKPIFQWRSPELDVAAVPDADQRTLLQGETVLAVELGEFEAEIVRKATVRKRPPSGPPNIGKLIFVNYDKNDRELSQKICQTLEKFGMGYAEPLLEGDPSEMRKARELCILNADALMIVYGEVPPRWVMAQGFEFKKYLPQREVRLHGFAIYEGPPEQKPSVPFRFPGMRIIECRNCFDEQKLYEFVQLIQRGVTTV